LAVLLVLAAIVLLATFVATWHLFRYLGVVDWRATAPVEQIGPAAGLTPTWRGAPFQIGERYAVLVPPGPPSSQDVMPGDIVTYQGSGYSRYDCASLYYFLTDSGLTLEWWLSDDQPFELASQHFQAVVHSAIK
jgi:hypothetical protein